MHQSRTRSTSNYFRRRASACIVTVYFWWKNIKGIHESSGKALRIMQITTVMVVILLIWCPLTLVLRGHVEPAAGADAVEPPFRARMRWAGSKAPSGCRFRWW